MVMPLQRTARDFSSVKLCVYLSLVCGACTDMSGELLELRSVHR